MIPDHDAMKTYLRNLEAGVNRNGWDQPHRLLGLYTVNGQPTSRELPLQQLPGGISEFLEWLAGEIRRPTYRPAALMWAMHAANQLPFSGLCVIVESWSNEHLSPTQMEELHVQGRSLADVPGSVESRDSFGIDVAGHMYQIHRQRGKKPIYSWLYVGGRLAEAMLDLVTAVAELMPPGEANLDVLRRLRLMSRDEADALWLQQREDAENAPQTSSTERRHP